MAINITQKNSTTNTTYLANRSLLYIVWHYTAGVTSKKGAALDTASWFANSAAQASADFIVDDYYIVQFNKDIKNRYCWAVGGGNYGNKGGRLYGKATNKNCISIEICSNNSSGRITYPNDPRYSVTEAALNNALQLTWYLMDLYGIDANHVIRHYDVNGKPCIGVIGWNAESNSETEWVKWHNKIAAKNGTAINTTPVASTDRYFVASAYTGGKYVDQHNTFNILENAKNDCVTAMKVSNKTFYVYDTQDNNKVVYTATYDPSQKHTQTSELKNLSDKDAADVLLEIVKPIALAKNLFPSVIAAQCILESGFGHKTKLSGYNNICGMKCDLLNSQWSGSAWDGKSRAKIYTPEEYTKGQITYIWAYFRAYHCIEDCITDMCAFLTSLPKYVNGGIMSAKNYKEQITLESRLGYATDKSYISKVCDIITRYDLDRYDSQKKSYVAPSQPSTPSTPTTSKTLYHVATSYSCSKYVGQIGAYEVLANATKAASEASQKAKKTYYVYDNTGAVVYTAEYKSSSASTGSSASKKKLYDVRVTTTDLRIRETPNGTIKCYIKPGIYGITEEKTVNGIKWGHLLSSVGWIALKYTTKL